MIGLRIVLPAVLAAGLLLWWAVRWHTEGHWRLGPLLLVLPLLLFAANEVRWEHSEREFTAAASPLFEAQGVDPPPSAFGCERVMRNFLSSHGRVGHVDFDAAGIPAERAFLSTGTCSKLKRFQADPALADLDQIIAAHTLAHEAAHLTGIRSESEAECLALVHDIAVMQQLGATADQAGEYRSDYLRLVYPRLPTEYRGECPGVGLD